MTTFVLCAVALFGGSIPFALLLGKVAGVDIRKVGSGNVGATNLARAKGLPWGVAAFLLDAAKGWAPTWWATRSDVPEAIPVLVGALAVLGHCFSPYLRFRGGKGVATASGALIALQPLLAISLLALWGLLLALVRNVGIASCGAALGAGAAGVVWIARGNWALGTLLVVLAFLVLVRHRSNLRSFFAGRRSEEAA